MSSYRIAEQRLVRLADADAPSLAKDSRFGLEKESLRVDPEGRIATTPHPAALGSALTHPYITTDFSEALVELITPPFTDLRETLQFLDNLHRFVYAHLEDDELLWATSMPCRVQSEESVPIAEYGTSNVGTMKHVYRRGLSYRYGRVMQAIAGVHFNYSAPAGLWPLYQNLEGDEREMRDFVSDTYFALIRNFQRNGWLIPYLFGTSPAVCKSFLGARESGLRELDRGTWYQPYATSLRMSDIGYKNETQSRLRISYDNLGRYVRCLTRAIETPHPDYEAIGVVVDGEYRQLNANILQIENEYYSFIRPKRVARSGEKPTLALKRRGVEYVEVRALDVSAFDPLGVNEDQLRFLEAFLVFCLLHDSPPMSDEELAEMAHNQQIVATAGRKPGLELRERGRARSLRDWALDICTAMQGVCEQLDRDYAEAPFARALAHQRALVEDPDALPSARMLGEMRDRNESFFQFAMRMSREHAAHFNGAPLPRSVLAHLREEARRSIAQQREIEAADDVSFEEYLRRYFRQSAIDREQLLA